MGASPVTRRPRLASLDPGDELLDVERLRQVVVGAGAEAGRAVMDRPLSAVRKRTGAG